MKLILVRHGLAVERDKFALSRKDDSFRPLVPKGIQRSEDMAKILKKWTSQFDMVVTSPYVRARQTAEIFCRVLKNSNLIEAAELVPQAPPMAFAQWLKVHADDCLSVLAVGHDPQLSSFATWCVSGQKESFIDFKKSGLISLEVESFADIQEGTARLEYVVSPKLFGI